jgi:hypothetical protein
LALCAAGSKKTKGAQTDVSPLWPHDWTVRVGMDFFALAVWVSASVCSAFPLSGWQHCNTWSAERQVLDASFCKSHLDVLLCSMNRWLRDDSSPTCPEAFSGHSYFRAREFSLVACDLSKLAFVTSLLD